MMNELLGIQFNIEKANKTDGKVQNLALNRLNRRSQKRSYDWDTFNKGLLKTFPLAEPNIKVSLFYR